MVSDTIHSINIEYLFRLLYEAVTGARAPSGAAPFFISVWEVITIISYLLSLIALFFLIYALMRLYEVRRREKVIYGPLPTPVGEQKLADPRWEHIQNLMESTNSNDWRQAIIEADIMLGDMLTRQGYQGETIGEQLQQVEPADFANLDNAWEAHKVRNQIAHAGSSFTLSETLARRTIAQYRSVFLEFQMI